MKPNRTSERSAVRFLVGLIFLFLIAALGILAAWAVLPRIALGWTPVTITSGSMAPLIDQGDVVIAEPHDGVGMGPGTVVVYEDPARTGYATHRIDGVADDGSYFTKGDANAHRDSTTIRPEDVVGTGRLLVPFVGYPVVWYRDGAWMKLALATLLIGAGAWCSRWAFLYDPWRAVDHGDQPGPPTGREREPVGALHSVAIVSILALLLAGVPPASTAGFLSQTPNPTNALGASVSFSNETFRVTTYEIGDGVFTGTSYTLTLDQDLADDYFVSLRGAAGANSAGTNRTPDQNYARVDGDPHANFVTGTAANQLRMSRQAASSAWQGQVTVVEVLADQAASGFTLLDVVEVSLASGVIAGSGSSTLAWSDINQVGLYGGIRGGGVATTAHVRADHMTAWARIFPTGTSTVSLERIAGGGGSLSGDTTFTVFVVEWGSEWAIQRVSISGVAGGNGVNLLGHYDTAVITPVVRDNSFVLAFGASADNGIGDGWEGQVFTLGDGVSQLSVETLVAVGAEYADTRSVEVYVHTHPSLAVDYRFGTDGGTPGLPTTALTGSVTVDSAGGSETYDNASAVRKTAGFRFMVIANSSNGTGLAYPRPIVGSRPTHPTTSTWTRSRSGQPGAFWLQAVDLSGITN